jgi:hypothetical protein
MLNEMPVKEDAAQIMDLGYNDYARLYAIHMQGAFSWSRPKTI